MKKGEHRYTHLRKAAIFQLDNKDARVRASQR